MEIPKRREKCIVFPMSVFQSAETKDDLEDWLLAQDPNFIKRMREARKQDLSGKGKAWKTLEKESCTG